MTVDNSATPLAQQKDQGCWLSLVTWFEAETGEYVSTLLLGDALLKSMVMFGDTLVTTFKCSLFVKLQG